MTASAQVLPLLVFEAADCLMAVTASEIAQLEKQGRYCNRRRFLDLDEYFAGRESGGPWLHWARGPQSVWLRVRRVIDVVPVALSVLTPLPAILTASQQSRPFVAAGLRGDDVFLLLDPARLCAERFGEAGP